MEVEIKNFYPLVREKNDQIVKGSLHVVVRLADIELNIRGILASKQKEKWFFRMPFKTGICHKKKTSVTYPILSFADDNKNRALLDAIYQKAPAFVEDILVNNPSKDPETISQVAAPRPKSAPPQAQSSKENVKVSPTQQKARSAPIKPKVFIDLPAKLPKLKSRQQ